MCRRLSLAALLIACLAVSAHAQKGGDKSKSPSTGQLMWETVASDPSTWFVTKRASVPGGWLVLVQAGESVSLTFLPDGKHRWEERSPSASKAAKGDKPKVGDAAKETLEKLKTDLEKARAMAAAERDKALASHQKAEEELK